MVQIPEDELERLKEKNRRQAWEISKLVETLKRKNLDLDALHFAWCDGGCPGGVHRFTHDVVLTEEMIDRAERNVKRMRAWYNTVRWRLTQYPTLSRWHRERNVRAAEKTDIPIPPEATMERHDT